MQIRKMLIVAMALGLVACASNQSKMGSPDQYAHKVKAQLDDGDLRAAESTLGEMELYYPISEMTQAMQLELISAYYKSADMDRTVVAAKRYANMFPNSANVDQAYYLSGMANYDRGLKSLSGATTSEKSPLFAKDAKESFAALLHCCGESPYARDASEKMAYLNEVLAQYEFGLMRADLLKGNRMAALSKGESIVDTYPATTAAGVAEVVLSSVDNQEVLDRLLIATALTINQDEAEAIVHKAGMVAKETPKNNINAASDTIEKVSAPAEQVAMSRTGSEMTVEAVPIINRTEAKVVPLVAEDKAESNITVASNADDSSRYTVQLGSSRKLATMQRYMQRLGLADVVNYERRMVNDEVWHAALYGAYADKQAAQRAADGLTVRTGVKDLWVRRLTDAPAEPRAVRVANESAKARVHAIEKSRAAEIYAIQVASEQSLDSLKAEMHKLKLDGLVEYHRRVVNDKTIYSALYGAYDDMESARAELPGLQSRLKKDGLWVRALVEEQKVIAE